MRTLAWVLAVWLASCTAAVAVPWFEEEVCIPTRQEIADHRPTTARSIGAPVGRPFCRATANWGDFLVGRQQPARAATGAQEPARRAPWLLHAPPEQMILSDANRLVAESCLVRGTATNPCRPLAELRGDLEEARRNGNDALAPLAGVHTPRAAHGHARLLVQTALLTDDATDPVGGAGLPIFEAPSVGQSDPPTWPPSGADGLILGNEYTWMDRSAAASDTIAGRNLAGLEGEAPPAPTRTGLRFAVNDDAFMAFDRLH